MKTNTYIFLSFAAGFAYLVMAAGASGAGFKLLGALTGISSILLGHYQMILGGEK